MKEDVRKLLERLIRTIEPDSRLLSFGSTANGFSLRNSDMDLCCLIDSEDKLAAADLVTMLGDLLERETKFHVKTLPHARIPIVKLTLDPSPGLPHGIACDIGFENRLALENTRLLMCYAMIDPTRVRTLVLFLKVWSKRRKINSPYKGTLSSYGYVLLVIYYLVHVKNPPVLPNLQQMPPLRPITKEETHLNGFNIWFFDDIDLLRQRWVSENPDSVAELLIDFFRYYARDFQYNTGVASIRSGLLKKEAKGWQNDYSGGRYDPSRERNRLCIEDPFEIDYNVARCVTKDGLYTIRGEFMRAARVLATRPDRAIVALAELCEERKDEELMSAPPFTPSRPPPQTPYTVGSHSMRPKGAAERLSPPSQFFNPSVRAEVQQQQQPKEHISSASPAPPEHMAPKRSKWTSPPPPDAGPADRTLFDNRLDKGIELATSSTEAREPEALHSWQSETNSEVFTDEERSDAAESDDIISVRSYTEGAAMHPAGPTRRPSWHIPDGGRLPQFLQSVQAANALSSSSSSSPRGLTVVPRAQRMSHRERSEPLHPSTTTVPIAATHSHHSFRNPIPEFVPTAREFPPSLVSSRRPLSGPPRAFKNGSPVWASHTPVAASTPLPPSTPASPMEPLPSSASSPITATATTVFYQTSPVTATRSPRPVVYPSPGSGSHSTLLSHYSAGSPVSSSPGQSSFHSTPTSPSYSQHQFQQLQQQAQQQQQYVLGQQVPPDILPANLPPALSSLNPRSMGGRMNSGPDTPTPGSYGALRMAQAQAAAQGLQGQGQGNGMHSNSNSISTVRAAPTPPPPLLPTGASANGNGNGIGIGNGSANGNGNGAGHRSPLVGVNGRADEDDDGLVRGNGRGAEALRRQLNGSGASNGSASPPTGSSPSPSSSTGYATSVSRSPSPSVRSLSPGEVSSPGAAVPGKVGVIAVAAGVGLVKEEVKDRVGVFQGEEGLRREA